MNKLEVIDKFEAEIKSKMKEIYRVLEEFSEEHGNKMDSNKTIKIEIEVTKEHIKVVITVMALIGKIK